MTTQTFTKSDTLRIASTMQSVIELISIITTDGKLNDNYQYIYTDLFSVLNGIYQGGGGLDPSLSDDKYNEINKHFDDVHYHISVAIGLAAGIITSPGVQPEINNAKDAADKANQEMQALAADASIIIENETTAKYISALVRVTNDPAINAEELIKTVLWTMILDLNKADVSLDDFNDELDEINLGLLNVQTAQWAGVFALQGLTINLDNAGQGDDLNTVNTVIGDLGNVVGVLAVGVVAWNWAKNGVNPFASCARIYQFVKGKFSSGISDEAADADMATAETVETATVEFSAADAIGGVLMAVGILLTIVGSIVEIVELSKALDKADDTKSDFQTQYKALQQQLTDAINASKGFAKPA